VAGLDLRGFTYALEPARKRRQWQFDASLARLAGVRRQIHAVEAERGAVQERYAAEAARTAKAWTERRDTATQEQALLFLSALRGREEELRRELEELALVLATALQLCAERQRELETLDRHRTDELKAHSAEQHRKSIVEADHEWSARAARSRLGENGHG
jgi:septal ring factor EnvC (AmiA/AmiB activator)